MLPSPEGVSGATALFPAYDVEVTLDLDFDGDLYSGFEYVDGSTVFSNLVDLTGISKQALSRVARDLEKREFLVMRESVRDRRRRELVPTDAGVQLVDSADALLLWDGKSVHLVPASAVQAVHMTG